MNYYIISHLFPCYSFQLICSFILFKNINLSYSLRSNEYLGNTSKHLFYFVQVTDIHITHFGHTDRMKQFEQFCNEIIKTLVRPPVTIVSGDLVNSVGESRNQIFGTGQYEQEWKIYKDILTRTNITKYTKWLDMRGNHDTFMDPHLDSFQSFYRKYSHQGRDHAGSYEYTLKTDDGDSYSFISVDMCPRPGLGRPFNFYGHTNKKGIETLRTLSENAKNSSSIIFFGHYPLTFSYSNGLHQIMKNGIVYLNGHLHSGIKHLYARHSNGLLELELGDWKDKRRFRIVTIDSGLLSFEDFRFNQSIYAVISNPKPAKFKTSREPLYRLSQSTHIRILIFAKFPITRVNISIDGKYIGSAMQSLDNPNLFIHPWNASFYNDGNIHHIFVEIKDNGNNTVTIEHEICLSLSTIISWNRSKFLLTIHQPTFGLTFLISSLCVYILLLLFYRYQAKKKQINLNGCFTLWNHFRLRMTLICSVDFLYYSLLGFALYHFIGPWYIGYLTVGHIGAVFLSGILIEGVYLPPDLQILLGTFQLYFFVFPLTFTLSSICFYRYAQLQSNLSRYNCCFRIYSVYIVYAFNLFFILIFSFMVTASYKLSWIISPFGLMLAVFSIVLCVKSHRLKIEDFKLMLLTKTNQRINEDNCKVEEEQSMLHVNKSQ